MDNQNAIMEIRAGTGGDEAALFAADLFRMYQKYAEKQNWQIRLLNKSMTSIGGFKEITLQIKGPDAFGQLQNESGVHRVQRIPKTEKSGRVHTSTATVAVLPEASDIDIKINPADIRIDTFCSSGPGGQYVNKRESAIRITHLASGIVVSCQEERTQAANKESALKVLKTRLLAKKRKEEMAARGAERREQIGSAMRAEKDRTYNFPQNRITDHRLKKSWHNLDKIIDGDLKPIVKAFAKAQK